MREVVLVLFRYRELLRSTVKTTAVILGNDISTDLERAALVRIESTTKRLASTRVDHLPGLGIKDSVIVELLVLRIVWSKCELIHFSFVEDHLARLICYGISPADYFSIGIQECVDLVAVSVFTNNHAVRVINTVGLVLV